MDGWLWVTLAGQLVLVIGGIVRIDRRITRLERDMDWVIARLSGPERRV